MPLYKGKENVGRNIKTEMAHGKPRRQAIAIAMNIAGISKKMKKKKLSVNTRIAEAKKKG